MAPSISRHIALIGFMGCGKSTVGPILAELLGVGFLDTDECIEVLTKKEIPQIFTEEGEPRFRQYEFEVLKKILPQPPKVIATGGGLVMQNINWKLLQEHTITVYLRVPIEVLLIRISDSNNRPLAANDPNHERIISLYHRREVIYNQAALIVDGTLSPLQVAKNIAKKIRKD